jgi:parvulin-like peptidyl-prolyl isomerase
MGEDFGKVVGKEAIGPEGVKGGGLGFVSLDIMLEEIDAAVLSKRPGGISTIVKSPHGYQIFTIIENDAGLKGGPMLKTM